MLSTWGSGVCVFEKKQENVSRMTIERWFQAGSRICKFLPVTLVRNTVPVTRGK